MEIASVAQVKDVFQALLDYLVEPVLPLKSKSASASASASHSCSDSDLSLQQSIAKQMHAVVLLYNYYHRTQFPHLDFLDFKSLCMVAVTAKPNLLPHLSYMKKCTGELLYNNLSLTEKAIMDACNISMGINTLKHSPTMEGWPLSDVAIFLIDSIRKNCFLQYGTTTMGVWSLIQKSYAHSLRTTQKAVNEAHLHQFALSAVQETTGICPNELTILEIHITYSLSEEKSTARLFIMKSDSVNDSVFQVPIQEAIESLQGPLVKRSCNSYIITDAVEHFHLLPYAGMIINWFSREKLANTSVLVNAQNISKTVSQKNDECIVSTGKREESSANCQGADFPDLKINNTRNSEKKENWSSHVSRHQNIDNGKSSFLLHLREERSNTLEVLDNAVIEGSTECDSRSTKNGNKVKEDMVDSVRKACNSEMDVDYSQTSMNVSASNDGTVVASEKVGVGRFSLGDVEILKTKIKIDGEQEWEKVVMLKELANIKVRSEDNPDRHLDSRDRISLEDAILEVFADVETSSMIRMVQDCQKWGETEDIRTEIFSRRNDLHSQSRKRHRVCVHNVNSDIDVDPCYKISGGNIFMTNNEDGGRLGHSSAINNHAESSVGGCGCQESLPVHHFVSEKIGVQSDFDGDGLDIGLKGALVHTREKEVESSAIPRSMPESLTWVGSVCFPQKYTDMYKRIVTKFGDVIMPESKEATLCGDMVSAAMKGLFEVVDSMLQVSPGAVDMRVVESWEMKIRFCEFAGLKVSWLRNHFEKMRKIPVIEKLEGQTAVLEECLEATRKRAADLCKELELVRAEEKTLMEKKVVVDTELEATRDKQECWLFDLF